jgi:hypothetical protein
MPGRPMVSTRSASDSFTPASPRGSISASTMAQVAPTAPTNRKVARHPARLPISEPIGAPSATAKVVPPITAATALARCSTPVIMIAAAWAVEA